MRIDRNPYILHINNIYDKVLTEGDILKGKIIDINGKYLLLHINELGTINAISEKNLGTYIGKEITFIVESLDENIIKVKPNVDKVVIKNQSTSVSYRSEGYIENVLKEFKIEKTQLNIEFVKSLIEYSIKLDEENILTGTSLLNKIKDILELDEEEIPLDNELKYSNITNKELKYTSVTNDNLNENKYILEDNDILQKDIFQLKYILKDGDVSLLPKTIAFFIKYNIKPSLNNIKNFIELNLDTDLFSEDYEILKNIINKEFTNHNKNIIISNEGPKSLIEESRDIYLNNVEKILKYLKEEKSKANKKFNDAFKRFGEKLELIKELNNGLTFIYLPLDLNTDLNSIITLIKKRRNKYDYQDTINVFLCLKTMNFGKVEIMIKVRDSDMEIEFSNLDRDDISYVKSKEENLRELVEPLGYNIISIDYVEKSNLNILNAITVSSNPLYCLDIKV